MWKTWIEARFKRLLTSFFHLFPESSNFLPFSKFSWQYQKLSTWSQTFGPSSDNHTHSETRTEGCKKEIFIEAPCQINIYSIHPHTHTHRRTQKQTNRANDIHMADTRCWRCYALMAEEHKGLFEAVTLILAARGSCGSAALKPLLAICWGHQKQVNQHLHQHGAGNQNPSRIPRRCA